MSHYQRSPSTSSTCYFCSETVDSKYLPEHVLHCGAVLEECPSRCGAYAPRSQLAAHLEKCTWRQPPSTSQSSPDSLEERIRSLQDSAWRSKVVSILSLLRTAVYDGERELKELRDTLAASLQMTNEALRRDILEELLANRRNFASVESRLGQLEAATRDLDRADGLCLDALKETSASFTAEAVSLRKMLQDQARDIADTRLELEMRCKLSKELVERYNTLFDRSGKLERRMDEIAQGLEQQRADWKTVRFQLRENLRYVEEIVRESRSGCSCAAASVGRLIWRIDSFRERMDEARRTGARLTSPRFLDREYGYTLRLELLLNGLGKWKNRHVIGRLRVARGDWDPLLEWPCTVRADVYLRDQEDPDNDLEKSVKAAKMDKNEEEEVEHTSDLYMFIPHSTLARHPGYTRENVMFLEIRVKQSKFRGSTVSLV